MSVPSIVKGQYWDVAVDVTTLALAGITGWVYLCGLNTRNITHQTNTTDEAIRDCSQPAETPWRILSATSQQKDIAGTGLHNRAQTNVIRAIDGKSLPYRFIEGEPGDDLVSQGYWEGPFMLTNWQEGAADSTNVTSQFSWASDGEILWVNTTAPTLVALGLTPLTATASTLWTGTLTGFATGSEVTATTVGGVVLTVDLDAGTVTGTFVATGSKVVTLTEINAEASNSPLVTTKTVVVS